MIIIFLVLCICKSNKYIFFSTSSDLIKNSESCKCANIFDHLCYLCCPLVVSWCVGKRMNFPAWRQQPLQIFIAVPTSICVYFFCSAVVVFWLVWCDVSRHSQGRSWLVRHHFAIMMSLYLLLLIFIGTFNSTTFLSFWNRLFRWCHNHKTGSSGDVTNTGRHSSGDVTGRSWCFSTSAQDGPAWGFLWA